MTDINEEKTKSFRMPLIEIIIVVAVFAIVSVFIMRMYVSADKLQHESELMSRAVIELQNEAEIFKGLSATDNVTAVMGLTADNSATAAMSFSEGDSASETSGPSADSMTSERNCIYSYETGEIRIYVSFSEKLSANGSFEEQTGKTVTALLSAVSLDGEKEYGLLTAAVYFERR